MVFVTSNMYLFSVLGNNISFFLPYSFRNGLALKSEAGKYMADSPEE